MSHLQRLLDRFLACRPTGSAKNSRPVLFAMYPVVMESFKLNADICEVLAVMLDRFLDMEYSDCVKALDAYASTAKKIDELVAFYNWCKDTRVARSSVYPEVHVGSSPIEGPNPIAQPMKGPSPKPCQFLTFIPLPEAAIHYNQRQSVATPENYTPPPPQPEPAEPPKPQKQQETGDLVDLREEAVTADDQGNRFALALFAGPAAKTGNGSWEAFPTNGEPEVTSAWQTPAAESGKAAMGGGLNPLLLNGIYDQCMVRQC
ncbi:Clathrin assembly protein [Actinidia chinensis var. chinensis]|uniref:Clathrin assembly protein n=1 Tax=Actinidia chinensis var. chinensis TaxID=1590841 RepID=A0A2R6QML6_ACTCC|nr:Clathrin assembly protein [Actinidia chinensis var. chinensis]